MFDGGKTGRLARRVAELEAKLDVLLHLTAIQMSDPGMYERLLRLARDGWEEPAAPQAAGRQPEPEGQDEPGPGMEAQLANMLRYTGQAQQGGRGE